MSLTCVQERRILRGPDRNPEAISHVVPEPEVEGFAQHTFESSGDVLEDHGPEVLPLPIEQCLVTGGPMTPLRRPQAKQLLTTTERILEVRASTSRKQKVNLEQLSQKVNLMSEILARPVRRNNHLRKRHYKKIVTAK